MKDDFWIEDGVLRLYSGSAAEVTIPQNIVRIDKFAFADCVKLTSVRIPAGVVSLGEGCFRGCKKLTNITVDTANRCYDSRNQCNAIIETATNRLMRGCSDTMIPKGITAIADYAFSHCSELKTIMIPDSVISIGNFAFEDCDGLMHVEISEGVTTIGEGAFINCHNLTSITIPDSIMNIGEIAFGYHCGLAAWKVADDIIERDPSLERKFTIFCNRGSYAEQYAKEQGVRYVQMEE